MQAPNDPSIGPAMDELLSRLFPICRSITGQGVRDTLAMVKEHIPLTLHEVPSGTQALDWTVPKEWNIRDAYILNGAGEKVVDFKKSNLHVVSYSTPVQATMPLAELRPHLHTIPEKPDRIPYRTSYYKEDWGFCLSQHDLDALTEGEYEVCIDSTLADGSLTYGELFIPGQTEDEVLLWTYICHPSLANDNLSGPVLLTFLAKELMTRKNRYSYRIVFAPETIGALVWLSRNKEAIARVKHGLVITCVGDSGSFTYKQSRQGTAGIDKIAARILKQSGKPFRVEPFVPFGSDERQFRSPGFNLPVGSLMRTPYRQYPAYHNSGDTLEFVRGAYIEEALEMYQALLGDLEAERSETYRTVMGFGEPQLGRRGLYANVGGVAHDEPIQDACIWVLNLSDGTWSLPDIAERSGLSLEVLRKAASLLLEHTLIQPLT